MKRLRTVMTLICMLPICCFAQDGGMVNWKFSTKKVTDQIYEFAANAVVAGGWHIYSQDSGEGSLPTKFSFVESPLFKLEGEVIEQGKLIKKKNDVLDSEIRYYADSVSFVQRVKTISPKPVVLKGTIEFMACNQDMCLPPEEIKFKIELK